MGVPILRRFSAAPRYGFLYSHILLLVLGPAVVIFGFVWAPYPPAKGLEIRTIPTTLTSNTHEEPLIVTLLPCAKCSRPSLYLNSTPISWEELSAAVRTKLSGRADRVVYIDADNDLSYGDVVHVIDIAEGAWHGVPVVLLTPELRKEMGTDKRTLRDVPQ